MCDGLKFESEQGGDPVLQPLLRFPEVWNPTLHALDLGSATGLTKGTIIPQKSPPDDNPERWQRCRDAAYSIRRTPRCYSSLANRPTPGLATLTLGLLPACPLSDRNDEKRVATRQDLFLNAFSSDLRRLALRPVMRRRESKQVT